MWLSVSAGAGGKLGGWRMLPGLERKEESKCTTTPDGRTRTDGGRGRAGLSWRENAAADAGRAAEPSVDHVAVASCPIRLR